MVPECSKAMLRCCCNVSFTCNCLSKRLFCNPCHDRMMEPVGRPCASSGESNLRLLPNQWYEDLLIAFKIDAAKSHQNVHKGIARASLYLKVELLPPLHGQYLNAASGRNFWRHMLMRLLVQAQSYILRICKQTASASATMASQKRYACWSSFNEMSPPGKKGGSCS